MQKTKGKEIEFKYWANSVSLSDFIIFGCKNVCLNYSIVKGTDYFYGNSKKPTSFFRHRIGEDMNQLTYKRKLNKKNNFVRIEHNIDVRPNMTQDQISEFCKELGFDYNTKLLKKASVFKTDAYNLVYYICYDGKKTELGRFIEIEMSEDYPWASRSEAFKELCRLEKKFKELGLDPKSRVKPSLYEMFKNNS